MRKIWGVAGLAALALTVSACGSSGSSSPGTAGSGVTGTLGTITRSDGTTQATYDGHPLYTYVGDKSPGQATGNGKNLSGGLWWEMTVSGSTPPATGRAVSKAGVA